MSIAELERFRADVQASEDLMVEAEAVEANPKAIVAFMVAKGYDVSEAEVTRAIGPGRGGAGAGQELSDDDLDRVSGGTVNLVTWPAIQPYNPDSPQPF